MQFTIPQFIDIEDKIIGPVSSRQFVIFLAGIGLLFGGFKLLPFVLFIFYGLGIIAMIALFGFVKINGQPFHSFLLNFIEAITQPRLKVWKKDPWMPTVAAVEEAPVEAIAKKGPVSASRLSQLSLVVDTGGAYHEDDWDIHESDFLKEPK